MKYNCKSTTIIIIIIFIIIILYKKIQDKILRIEQLLL